MIRIKKLRYEGAHNFRLSVESLDISTGEKAAVFGPSGSGKTTFLKLIAGLEEPDSGEISLNGKLVTTAPPIPPHQRNISLLSQDFGLWGHLTAIQHLAFVRSKGKTLKPDETDHALLRQVRIDGKADIRPGHLSGGEQQRLALARAIAGKPSILLLDEPFSNLDPVLSDELSGILNDLQAAMKFTRIQVSHEIASLKNNADRIIILYNGRVIQQGRWNEIKEHPSNNWVEKLVRLTS